MRTNHVFLVAFLMFFTVYSQDFSGVIKDYKGIWLMGNIKNNNLMKDELLNFHLPLTLDDNTSQSIKIKKGESNLFVVFRDAKNKELVQFTDEINNTHLFSTRIKFETTPSITFNNKPSVGNIVYYNWHNINKERLRKLSLVNPTGLYEVIYIPGRLDQKSRQLIFTYLSLKYGISLSNAQYRTVHKWIWEKKENKEFNYRVFGLAREDYFNLKQYYSQNSKFPYLKVGVEKKNIPLIKDGFYLMLGDNDGALKFSKNENDEYAMLQRTWKVRISDIEINYFIDIDSKFFSSNNNEIWMIVSDNKELSGAKWIKGQELPDGKIHFSDVHFNKSISYLGFVQAPAFFANLSLTNPECGTEEGNIKISIKGGVPPYFVKLYSSDGSLVASIDHASDNLQMNLKKGNYTLEVTDSRNGIFTKNISILNKSFENISLKPVWLLNDDNFVEVSPNIHSTHEFKYHWVDKFNNRELGTSPTIQIHKEGTYSLTLENEDGCNQTFDFNVYRNNKDEFTNQHVKIFPTILQKGQQLHVQLSFSENKSGHIHLYDLYGRLLISEQIFGKRIHKVFRLDRAGEYLLIILVNNKTIVQKIIVESAN